MGSLVMRDLFPNRTGSAFRNVIANNLQEIYLRSTNQDMKNPAWEYATKRREGDNQNSKKRGRSKLEKKLTSGAASARFGADVFFAGRCTIWG
jgi:hypothetical protein